MIFLVLDGNYLPKEKFDNKVFNSLVVSPKLFVILSADCHVVLNMTSSPSNGYTPLYTSHSLQWPQHRTDFPLRLALCPRAYGRAYIREDDGYARTEIIQLQYITCRYGVDVQNELNTCSHIIGSHIETSSTENAG